MVLFTRRSKINCTWLGLPIGPLRWFIGAPELHHWHHDRARDAGNYANISPLMDIIFGTYRCPDHEPAAFGIHGPSPRTYLGHMIRPLLPRIRVSPRAAPNPTEEPVSAGAESF